MRTKHRGQDWQDLDRPAMNRGVIDDHSTLGLHHFNVAQSQRAGRVPANADQHHLQRVVQPLDHLAQRLNHPPRQLRLRLPAPAYCDRTPGRGRHRTAGSRRVLRPCGSNSSWAAAMLDLIALLRQNPTSRKVSAL